MFYKKSLGRYGETIALKYYQRQGYKKIANNFYTRYGELDLVLRKNQTILVVEVKTRTNLQFGWAEESINNKKLTNINKAYQIISRQQSLPQYYQLEICIIELRDNRTQVYRFEI